MSAFKLSEELILGIQKIDDQHKRFVDMLNRMTIALHHPYPEEEMEHLIPKLSDFSRHHFDTEEGLLREINFPQIRDHSIAHTRFVNKVQIFSDGLLIQHTNMDQFVLFTFKWLQNHIKSFDTDYYRYLTKHNLLERIKAKFL
jgi:hemerythrin